MARNSRHKKTASLIGHRQAEVRRAEIDNPYFQKEHREGATNPRKIRADVNIRESAVETLYARRFLSRSQKRAADHVRELWEKAGGKASSIDYTAERVDHGRNDAITDHMVAAHELKRCRQLLGARGFDTLLAVCAEGRALTELSPHKRARLTMADNLRADLDDVAAMWGMQTRQRHTA